MAGNATTGGTRMTIATTVTVVIIIIIITDVIATIEMATHRLTTIETMPEEATEGTTVHMSIVIASDCHADSFDLFDSFVPLVITPIKHIRQSISNSINVQYVSRQEESIRLIRYL